MLFRYLGSGLDPKEILVSLLLTIPIILISLTVHEVAHGYVSYKLGDPTARNLGRLTLNPLKHIDPIGAIAMLLFGIGWAKPVPVNSRYYKKPKKGMALTALAGPCANVILSFIGVIVVSILALILQYIPVQSEFSAKLIWAVTLFLVNFVTMNAYLAVFNLLPIPPFDGSRIALVFLPDKYYFAVMKYERIIMLAMLVLLYTGFLTTPLGWLSDVLVDGMFFIVNSVIGIFVH